MLKNHLIITLRNLLKYRVYSFINIIGLAVGLAACLLIFLFIHNEQSFDGFHSQKEHVYRLNEVQTWDGIIPQNVALSMYPMGPTLQADFPEVETFTRLLSRDEVPMVVGNKKIYIEKMYLVDSMFFEVFDFELAHGDPQVAFQDPLSMVITEETAMKFFARTDVVGEQMEFMGGDTIMYNITGVLKNVPDNSHLQFDGLASLNSVPEANENWMQNWGSNWLNTYLKLTPGTDIAALETKFPDYLTKYMGENATDGYQLFLQPLSEIHLGSTDITHDYQNIKKFNGKYIYTFLYLGLFVLLIGGINFMNLTTARSSQRAKEVGVRKAIGATKQHLRFQFLAESVILAFAAMILALFITAMALPVFNDLSLRAMKFTTLLEPMYLGAILGVTLLLGVLAGLYPAVIMSAFKPVSALKSKVLVNHRKISLQDVLVVTQFAIATAMIVGTILTSQQLNFMIDRDPGFTKDQVVLIPSNREVRNNFDQIKDNLLQYPAVKGVTASGQRLGNNIHQTGISFRADTAEQNLAISHVNVDYDFVDFYEIELLEGRAFSKEFASDGGHGFIINEQLAAKLGVEDPVGMPFKFGWQEEWGTVIGLAKDFNFDTYHHDINPLAMSVQPNWGYSELSVSVDPQSMETVMPLIEQHWRESGTDRPFDYEFLDEHFAELYRADTQVSQIVGLIAGLAIIIACLGLFGLVSVSVERRIKEIGIRKVLGASAGEVLYLLSKGVLILVLIGFAIAVPITVYYMQDWLTSFAYRIEVGPGVFILTGVIMLIIALGTISFLTLRAARRNPVEALRYE